MAATQKTARLVAGLAPLVERLQRAKEAEDAANLARIDAEAQIIAACEFSRPEGGSMTFRDSGDHEIGVTLKQPMNPRVDEAAWRAVEADLPANVREVVRWKPDVSLSVLNNLSDTEKVLVAPYITIKPGKIGVEVK